MKQIRYAVYILFCACLISCGGDTLESVNDPSDPGTDPGNPTTYSISLQLVEQDSGDTTTTIAADNPGLLLVTVTDESGNAQANQLVNVTTTIGALSPSNGNILTDNVGLAQISVLAGSETGAGQLVATIGTSQAALAFQVGAANIRLGACDTSGSTVDCSNFEEGVLETPLVGNLIAGGTTTFTATIVDSDGNPFTDVSTEVTFSSSCASAQPPQATLDEVVSTINGVATSTYLAQGCEGQDTIIASAQSSGLSLIATKTISVEGAEAGSIQFVSATPEIIALAGSGGVGRSETSEVVFKVVDENGIAKANQQVTFSLSTTVGGLTLGNITKVQTNAEGLAQTIVQAGNVSTPVTVTADVDIDLLTDSDGDGIVDNDKDLSTTSSQLVVSTGLPDQNSFSLSAETLNPEALIVDGVEVLITARLADHFNNPVPDGTAVSFTAEFGAIQPSCTTVNGACSVNWISQAPRSPDPIFRDANAITRFIGHNCTSGPNGLPCPYSNATSATTTQAANFGGLGQVYGNRVTIMAHVVGEESFTDANANGIYDNNEAFTDLTEAFQDDNEDGVFGAIDKNGNVVLGASSAANNKCYEPYDNLVCFQVGGDNEEYVDFNVNGEFDVGNGLYNGTLCTVANEQAGICSRSTLTISRNLTLLMSGSNAEISIIVDDPTLDPNDINDYFTTLDLGVNSSVNVRVSDIHNGLMPQGTVISADWGNGDPVGPTEYVVGNSSGFALSAMSFSADADNESDSGVLVISVTTPGGVITSRSITVVD